MSRARTNGPEKLRRLEVLARVDRVFNSSLEPERVLNLILREAVHVMRAQLPLGEVEVDASAALATAQPAASIAEAQAKARDEGMKAERDYRNMFNTTVGAAGLDAAGATEFEKQFYGRSETDLKFLASHAIGKRARAVGEEAPGNGEGEQKTDAAKAEAIVGKAAAERFNSERQVRQMFGILGSVSATDPSYQAAMNRYVASAQKQAKDEAAQTASATAAK